VHISVKNKKMNLQVHRAVLLAFKGKCPPGMEACHNNGDAGDNRPRNLRWDTHAANNGDRKRHGRYAVGEGHPMAKLTIAQVRVIRAAGSNREGADMAGVSLQRAWAIRTGRSWGNVK
jgi:hypothetical protein